MASACYRLAKLSLSCWPKCPPMNPGAALPPQLVWRAPPIHLQLPEALQPIDPQVAEVLFRTAQEALTNVARHAHAASVRIHLREDRVYVYEAGEKDEQIE